MLKLWIIEVVRVWSFFKVCILAKNTYMLDAKTNKQFTRNIGESLLKINNILFNKLWDLNNKHYLIYQVGSN